MTDTTGTGTTGSETYDVVLLVEQPLSRQDAEQVRGLHQEAPEPVRYHLLLPVEDAAARVETSMGALTSGDALVAAPMMLDQDEVEKMQRELLDEARAHLDASLGVLEASGATATGELVTAEPIEALARKVQDVGAAEVIVLTRPHVVAEFFHVDWTSRARRKLGVPVLHLLEHETFEEQGPGGGEGITGV